MRILEKNIKIIVAAAVAAAISLLTSAALAFPDKPIRLIVPQPPGGAGDVVGRMLAEHLKTALGQPVLAENRAGAAGVIAAETVARAAPDGYTLLIGGGSTHGANSALNRKLSYDPIKDFAPISLLVRAEWGMFVNPAFPAKTTGELIALAKAKPGAINFASAGLGSASQLIMEQFLAMTGIDLVHIPYKGSVAAQVGTLTNDAQVVFDGIGNAAAQVRAGKLIMIAVASARRSPLAPGTPTIAESGVPGFEASSAFGIYAPAGTPNDVVATLNRALLNVLKQPEFRQWLTSQAYEIVGSSPEQLAEEVAREIRKWRQLAQERNLKFD